MASPRRRSARLRGTNPSQSTSVRKTHTHLGDLLERDETPDVVEQQQSIDDVVATPASSATLQKQLQKLSELRTPKTEPRPERGEMHPKTIHQTTTKAPDSGLKLGFVDIPAEPHTSLASIQNTPSKSWTKTIPKFEFKFNSESELSLEAQKLMDKVREDATMIKVQMQAEKSTQEQKDIAAEKMFEGINASGRKIAKPKGRVGRFSDIHMAQFKKMDSIANHASSFRVKSNTAPSQAPSLKRSGSRAGLDEPERPRTAGKGTTPRPKSRTRIGQPSPNIHRKFTVSGNSNASTDVVSTKRIRRSEPENFTAVGIAESSQGPKPSNLPKSFSSNLLSPTKASMARTTQIPRLSPSKSANVLQSETNKSNNVNTSNPKSEIISSYNTQSAETVSKISQPEYVQSERPLPAVPVSEMSCPASNVGLLRSKSISNLAASTGTKPLNSKLPIFSGLKSILRSARKMSGTTPVTARSGSPKRPKTANAANDSPKKVDFTPSVKSRYAVKLAASSPSPAKFIQPDPAHLSSSSPLIYDSAAYMIEKDHYLEDWVEKESEIQYPTLPEPDSVDEEGPVVHTFAQKVKDHGRRESKEFKSIFTTLHHPSRPCPPSKLTTINTEQNQTNTAMSADQIMRSPNSDKQSNQSQPTIRHVRNSGVTDFVKPFEDSSVDTVPHGLPGKKRRHESIAENDRFGQDEDAKENRRVSVMPHVPGGWQDSILDEDDEGDNRAGKRVRLSNDEGPLSNGKVDSKKPSAAREAAAKNAKERKGKNILSLSRLNMLSRPKQRN